jgi:hypothetical protein
MARKKPAPTTTPEVCRCARNVRCKHRTPAPAVVQVPIEEGSDADTD